MPVGAHRCDKRQENAVFGALGGPGTCAGPVTTLGSVGRTCQKFLISPAVRLLFLLSLNPLASAATELVGHHQQRRPHPLLSDFFCHILMSNDIAMASDDDKPLASKAAAKEVNGSTNGSHAKGDREMSALSEDEDDIPLVRRNH